MKFELLEVAGTHIFSMKAMTLVLFFIFAIIVVGYLVGKISIKGVSLGSAAIFLVALVAGHLYQKIGKTQKSRYVAVVLGGVADIILVAGGYFVCEYFIYGAGAAASIPANIIQGIGGLVISCILYPILISIPNVRQMTVATR